MKSKKRIKKNKNIFNTPLHNIKLALIINYQNRWKLSYYNNK